MAKTSDRKKIWFYLVGADGKTIWRLNGGGPITLLEIPEGLGGAPVEHDYQELVGLPGGLWRGSRDLRPTITMKVKIQGEPGTHHRALQSQFIQSLGRGRDVCRLYVVTPEWGYWWLDCRLESLSEIDYLAQMQPGELGMCFATVRFTADSPWWQRTSRVFRWTTATGIKSAAPITASPSQFKKLTSDIFGAVNGPDNLLEAFLNNLTMTVDDMVKEAEGMFEREENRLLDMAIRDIEVPEKFVTNPGDQPAWPVWIIQGSFNSIALGTSKYDYHILPYRSDGYYIDTDPLFPVLENFPKPNEDIVDLSPEFPEVIWTQPLPGRAVKGIRHIPILAEVINPGPDFALTCAIKPRSEQPW